MIALTLLQIQALRSMVYAPDLKADWRACSLAVAMHIASHPGEKVTFVVKPPEGTDNFEIETARYYLPGSCRILAWQDKLPADVLSPKLGEIVYLSLPVGREPAQASWLDGNTARLHRRG